MTHVTVVGAGPAGGFLGQELKKRGIDCTLYEEHQEVGSPVQCTGLISNNIEEFVEVPKDSILSRVKGAKLYSPGGQIFNVSREKNQAYVVNRTKFDQGISKGLDIQTKTVANLEEFSDSDYIVGADGPNSVVAREAGLPKIQEFVLGVQYDIENTGQFDSNFVELYFGNKIAPGFFAWSVPTGKYMRVGLATWKHSKQHLDTFIEQKFGKVEVLGTTAGLIPLKIRPQLFTENIAVLGDAAGQVKPTTGGGIYMAMASGKCLAEAIEKKDLNHYSQEFNQWVKPELIMGKRIRQMIKGVSDKEMESVWKFFNKPSVQKQIVEWGDMDKPTLLVKAVLKNPWSLTMLPYARYLLYDKNELLHS